MMNLGHQGAKGVKVGLRSPDKGGGVWAEGQLDIPARSVAVGTLLILPGKKWHGWTGTEVMEVEAPSSEVFNFTDSRYTAKFVPSIPLSEICESVPDGHSSSGFSRAEALP